MNYLAIVIAAVAAWIIGAIWYSALSKPWMAAQGWSQEKIAACKGQKMPVGLLVFTFVAELVMAAGLSHIMSSDGELTIIGGIMVGGGAWLFFVITTMAVNNAFQQRKIALTIIDGGAWLAALLAQGVIIGAFGA